MNFLQFCQDYGIATAPHGHKHQRPGWINIVCPFCTGNPGYHLGFQVASTGTGFVCFRCLGHGGVPTIARLARCSHRKAAELIESYGGRAFTATAPKRREWQISTDINLPLGTRALTDVGKQYLIKRKFDPDYLVKNFGLQETGPVGNYRYRIVIPVFFNGYVVSYTCRSYAGSDIRYKACAQSLEAIPAKDVLYNIDNVPNKQKVVVVEGCTDVWRLGDGAVGTFGTKITPSQLKFLVQFKRVVLIRDMDEAGAEAWEALQARLCAYRIDAVIHKLDVSDAAELDEREAKYLMRQL